MSAESTDICGPALIAGATSTLGWALYRINHFRDRIPVCNTHTDGAFCRKWSRVNTEDTDEWLRLISRTRPAYLIYCAGVCNVKQCERYPAWARRINVDAVAGLAEKCPPSVRLVYVSSDHVFGGRAEPYTESDVPDPVSLYGRLRVEAERLIRELRPDALIIRHGPCIGPSPSGRKGHWDSLAYRLSRGRPVTVIEGEQRSAVWADDAAGRVLEWAESGHSGVRHITAGQSLSRPALAAAICRARGLPRHFVIRNRRTLDEPHLGKVELATEFNDTPLRPAAASGPIPHATE